MPFSAEDLGGARVPVSVVSQITTMSDEYALHSAAPLVMSIWSCTIRHNRQHAPEPARAGDGEGMRRNLVEAASREDHEAPLIAVEPGPRHSPERGASCRSRKSTEPLMASISSQNIDSADQRAQCVAAWT